VKLLAAFAIPFALVVPAFAASVTGSWRVSLDPGFTDQPTTLRCEATHEGQQLILECDDGSIAEGTVEGSAVRFVIMTGQNNLLPARFTGALDANETVITGTWRLEDTTGNRIGRFSAEKAATLAIPFLASASKPADLDFMAAECDVHANGERLACRVRQLFLTVSSIDATACVITTNGYEQTFTRAAAGRWASESAAEGECGIVTTTTLEDGGGTRWTMTMSTRATRHLDVPACRSSAPPEVYDWRSVKRALPCSAIQPGAIER
jgi:hypothetical protein